MSDELVDAFNTLSHAHHGTLDPNMKNKLLDGTMTGLRVLLEQVDGRAASESPVLVGPHKGEQPTSEELVGAVNALFGVHHGLRSLHTKGVLLEGTFAPSASAMTVSSAGHFQDRAVRVIARFSNFAGLPNIADNDPMASPRGMAIKFYLPEWSETDIIAHSYNGFPTKTASEFKDLLLALAAAGNPGAPDPAALNQFLSTHPIAKVFLEAPKPAPASYATIPYFGVNAFKFTNAQVGVTFGRYQIRPAAPEQYLSADQLANQGADYLVNEIAERVSGGPVKFKVLLQVADESDALDDPSIAWPDSRPVVELGTIQISMPITQPINADRKALFSPGNLIDGIEAADPMISAMSGAYGVDFVRRTKS